jgi:glycosyltransferase 2 family protein
MSGKRRDLLLRVGTVLAVLVGGWLLYRAASRYSAAEIMHTLEGVTWSRLGTAFAFAVTSYLCLTINDWLGLRYIGHPLPYRLAALSAFVALALGHNIGFSGLSSGAIRYRFYSRWGLKAAEVAKLVLFGGATVMLGLSSWAALVLIGSPQLVGSTLGASQWACRLLGGFFGALVAGYVGLSVAGKGRLSFRRWTLVIPKPSLAIAQALLGIINYGSVAACLKAALGVSVPYLQVAAAFVVGNTATLLTHVPGGLGVIETAVVYLVPEGGSSLGGGLVLFRLVYYLLPLGMGLLAFLLAERRFRSSRPLEELERPGRVD